MEAAHLVLPKEWVEKPVFIRAKKNIIYNHGYNIYYNLEQRFTRGRTKKKRERTDNSALKDWPPREDNQGSIIFTFK